MIESLGDLLRDHFFHTEQIFSKWNKYIFLILALNHEVKASLYPRYLDNEKTDENSLHKPHYCFSYGIKFSLILCTKAGDLGYQGVLLLHTMY